MELHLLSPIGDQTAATGVVREWKREHPEECIRIFNPRPGIWDNNRSLRIGNKDNGLRVSLLSPGAGRLTGYYADRLRAETGERFDMVDDSPEIHLSDAERAFDFGLKIQKKSVAIDPWAASPLRRWPYERFARLSKLLHRAGWQVIAVGAGPERPYPLPFARDLHDRLSIRQTAALLARVSLYVGNDSGLMHLAAGVGTRQVALYGVVEGWRRAYRTTTPIDAVRCEAKCRSYELARCAGAVSCLESISVDQVLQTIEGLK